MALDHAKAIVSMRFTGLSLFQINEDRKCEVGMVLCEHHRVSLDIQKETPQGTTLLQRKMELNGDIKVEANSPEKPGVTTYPEERDNHPFDRVNEIGDAEDFRWVVDHESSLFYNQPLALKAIEPSLRNKPNPEHHSAPKDKLERENQPDSNKATIGSRFFINHCVLYTALRTDYKFVRVIAGDSASDGDGPFIGRIAYVIGADIFSSGERGSEVVVTGLDIGGEPLRLKWEPGTKYWINVDNSCSPPIRIQDGSDFQLYYDVIDIGENPKYDLRRALDNGGNPGTTERLITPGLHNISLDGRPDVCNGSSIGIGKN